MAHTHKKPLPANVLPPEPTPRWVQVVSVVSVLAMLGFLAVGLYLYGKEVGQRACRALVNRALSPGMVFPRRPLVPTPPPADWRGI